MASLISVIDLIFATTYLLFVFPDPQFALDDRVTKLLCISLWEALSWSTLDYFPLYLTLSLFSFISLFNLD